MGHTLLSNMLRYSTSSFHCEPSCYFVDEQDEQNINRSSPKWVALAVVQSYNPRCKVPRSKISLLHLESCLSKAAFSASQNSGNLVSCLLRFMLNLILTLIFNPVSYLSFFPFCDIFNG